MLNLPNQPLRLELPTPFAVGPVNAYLFIEPEPVLVDTGVDSPESWAALTAGLAAHGLTIHDLERVIITHPHVDHFAQAYRLLQNGRLTIHVSPLGESWLIDPRRKFQERLDYYRQKFLPQMGLPENFVAEFDAYMSGVRDGTTAVPAERLRRFPLDGTLTMGGADWQVIHAPGHASHQTCFFQPESGYFLSADLLLPITPTPIVERPSSGTKREQALPRHLESLRRAHELPISRVFPGHGEIFIDHRALIDKQVARIHERKEETYRLLDDGPQTAVSLLEIMYAHYPPNLRFAGLWMLVGYLDLLENEGRVTAVQTHGVIQYHQAQ